jgi:hypothetical protein
MFRETKMKLDRDILVEDDELEVVSEELRIEKQIVRESNQMFNS